MVPNGAVAMTVSVTEALRLPTLAEIVALPGVRARTKPFGLTLATLLLVLAHAAKFVGSGSNVMPFKSIRGLA